MKIFCYLWLAFLVVCFVFEKVAAWLSNNKRFYKDEIYSYPENDYESFEFTDDDSHNNNNVRKRNERESDFYDIDENIYDSSNDMYPSLNLFSWWSSKNKGINRNNNKKNNNNNDDINDNKLKKEFIKNILENGIFDDMSNETTSLKMKTDPIGLSNFLYTTYPSRVNLQLNFIERSTKRYNFLHQPSTTMPPMTIINYLKNPIKNDFDKTDAMIELNSQMKDTTENVTETISSYYKEKITEGHVENGTSIYASLLHNGTNTDASLLHNGTSTDASLLHNGTSTDASFLLNDLKGFTSYNSKAGEVKKEISATKSYSICKNTLYRQETANTIFSSLKPTFRTCLPKKEKIHGFPSFSRIKEAKIKHNAPITNKNRSSNNSTQITGSTSSSCSCSTTALDNIYTENMSATKQTFTTRYHTPGHVLPPTSGIIKQALMNISRQFNLYKGMTIPFPQTADGGILKIMTSTPIPMHSETFFTPIPSIPQSTVSAFVNENRKNVTKEEDPFSFLKPIPTLKTDIIQKTRKGNNEIGDQHANAKNGNKKEEINTPKSHKYNIYLKNNSNNSDVSNGTEPKFVLPEYLSGLYRSDNNNNNRRKRTSKNAITNISNNDLIKMIKNNFPTSHIDIRKLIGRQCENSGETTEDFLSKFKNLQNDLVDLQKALVAEAKDLSSADDYTPMINDRNMSVHVRVIVDVLNGTDGNHLTSASGSSLVANRSIEDLAELNHTLAKRSWFLVPPSDMENQQHVIEKIIQHKVLDELEKSVLKKTDDENFLEGNNDDLKVNLNFPSLSLEDDIATTTSNPIISTDISSYDNQNNLSKQKGSKFVLTKTQLVDPIAKNNIVNPVNKAIYSKYLTGKKYLVIPLSYLEEQNKKSNNNSYNILQPTSVFFKILGNNAETDKDEPKNFIAKYLNKISLNKKTKATNKVKKKLYLNNLKNEFKDSNNRQVDLITERNGTTNIVLGEPEMIECSHNNKHKIVMPYKDDNLNNIDSRRKSDHSVTFLLDDNELLKDSLNADSLNLNDVDNGHTRPVIQCIKYPLYNLGSYQLRHDNNENELQKARRESNCRITKPFLFFTLPNNELNDFHTEKPPCTSYCKLNMAPLVKYKDSNYNYTNNKPTKTKASPNLKTFKVDLNIDEDPFDRLDWNLLQNKNSLNGPRQYDLTSSDTQGAMLFASKVNKRKRGIQNVKSFKRIPRENNLRNEDNLMKIKHKMNGVDKVRGRNRQTVPLVIKKINSFNRKLDKSKYSSYNKKLTGYDSKYGSKLTNNMDEDKIQIRMRTSNLIDDSEYDDPDSGIAEMMNTNHSRYYSLHGTPDKTTSTQNIVRAKLKDFAHKLQDSFTVKASTTSKSTSKHSRTTTSKHSDVKNETCTTKNEECSESEDICTGIPPSTLNPAGTKQAETNKTATPSEQEIEDACTECICGNHVTITTACTKKNVPCPGGNHKKVHEHTSVKPRGAHCHHHLKNHTTLQHHKFHEHNKSDSGKNGTKKECIKEK